MKRLFLSILFPLLTFSSWGQEVIDYIEIDGVEYSCYSDRTAMVIKGSKDINGSIVIPRSVYRSKDGFDYSVTCIRQYAFSGCSGLTDITIPSSVTSIGKCAFYQCSGLTSITFPSSITSIGQGAFYQCSGLTSITFPSSITSIGQDAFQGCSGLTDITIPSSVTSIGKCAFYQCSNLKNIYVNWTSFIGVSFGESIFSESSYNEAIVYFPEKYAVLYLSTSPWNNFDNIKSYVSISLSQSLLFLEKGQAANLIATILPTTFSNNVTWISSNANVADVNNSGTVTAKNYGTAIITAKMQGVPDLQATCTVKVNNPSATGTVSSDIRTAAYWFASGSMKARSGKDEIHVNTLVPGSGVSNDKIFTTNLLNGFIGAAVVCQPSLEGLNDTLTIVFDVAAYNADVRQAGLSGRTYMMTATEDVVYATYNNEKMAVVRLLDTYDGKAGRYAEFQHNDFAYDLLNAKPTYNIDGITTSSFYTKMTFADRKNVTPMNLLGSTTFDVRYFRPFNSASRRTGKYYFDDANVNGYDVLEILPLLDFVDWRMGDAYHFNTEKNSSWIDFYGVSVLFNPAEVLTDLDNGIQLLSRVGANLSLTLSNGEIIYRNNGTSIGKFNLFIPCHIKHHWGELVKVIQIPVLGTTDKVQDIAMFDDATLDAMYHEVLAIGISLNQTNLTLTSVGQTATLTATVSPSNASNKNVTWTSSNPSVATVSNGVVTAVANGTTTITVRTADGSNKTATCAVTVNISSGDNTTKKVIGTIGEPITSVSDLVNGGTYLMTSVGRHANDGIYLYENDNHYLLFESVAEGHDANAALIVEIVDGSHIYIKTQSGYYIPPYADPRGRFKLSETEKEPLLIEAIDGVEGQFTLAYTTYAGGSTAYPNASTIYLDADAANLSNWGSRSGANGNGAFRFVPVTLVGPDDQTTGTITYIGSPITSVSEIDANSYYLLTSVGRHGSDGQYLYERNDIELCFEEVAVGHDQNAAFRFEPVGDNQFRLKTISGNYIPTPKITGWFTVSADNPATLLIEPINGVDDQFTLSCVGTGYYLDADRTAASMWHTKGQANGNGAYRIVYCEIERTTAIDNVIVNSAVNTDQSVYTLQGQRVTNTRNLRPGVYIIGGKKVLIK